MKDKTATILKIFLAVLLLISLALFVLFYIGGEQYTNTVLTWAYILFALAVVITILFPIAYFISNPKKGKKMLIGLVGFAILFVIAYYMSSGDVTGGVYEKFDITESTSRIIGAMLNTTFLLGAIAVLSVIYAGISGFFK